MSQQYNSFIRAAKRLSNDSEDSHLRLMLLLVETEPKTAIWYENPHGIKSWEKFLLEEGLCTPSKYYGFKAANANRHIDVKTLGVYASILIQRLPKDLRSKVIEMTREWIKNHRVPPTYQRISTYVKVLRGKQPKKLGTMASLRDENARLKKKLEEKEAYILLLKSTLTSNKIRVPREAA